MLLDPRPEVRGLALTVLTASWRLHDHLGTALRFLRDDPDSTCRSAAAFGLGVLRSNTDDGAVLRALARVVRNREADDALRRAAYAAMRAVTEFDPREQIAWATGRCTLERDADLRWADELASEP